MESLICRECGSPFARARPRGRVPVYCTDVCRLAANRATTDAYNAACRAEGACYACPRNGDRLPAVRYGMCEEHAARMDRHARARRLRAFRLTEDAYAELLAAQGGVCAICGAPPEEARRLAVDHDHSCCPFEETCGECVRGLLCSGCNTGIGLLRDDPVRLRAAADYLEAAR